jgi:hypothetical protein
MPTYTNNSNIPLSVAVWLAHDTYDHDERENLISATSLLKPIRQIVLSKRVDRGVNVPDIASLIPSRTGTAVHDGLETAWVTSYKEGLSNLGIPQRVINKVKVNPKFEELTEDTIPVYLELRSEKEVDGFIISGKFDFVGEGRVEDLKNTSVYTYINKTNDDKYIMQGSIYRWLNPDIITRDEMAIQFIFKDWQATRTKEPKYPNASTLEYRLPLKSVIATETFIRNKLTQIKKYENANEADIPECTNEDLWRKADTWKYYKNPLKMTRSTKNFDNQMAADMEASLKGGIVVKKGGDVTACKYCDAFPVCKQKDRLIATGELILRG